MEYLGDLLYNIVTAIFYIPMKLILLIISIINHIINVFIELYIALTGLITNVYNYISNLFTGILPYSWITLILLGFLLVGILRIYHFIKDISIFGNKI